MSILITHRDGPARIAQWTHAEFIVETPALLFNHSQRITAPECATAVLSENPGMPHQLSFQMMDSFFERNTQIKATASCTFSRFLLSPLLSSDQKEQNPQQPQMTCCAVSAQSFTEVNHLPSMCTSILALTHARQMMQHQSDFVRTMCSVRDALGYNRLLYVPSVATPMNVALLSWMGVDVFDTTLAVLAARNNSMFFPTGSYQKDIVHAGACTCVSCTAETPNNFSFEQLLLHNYTVLQNEIQLVKTAITNGCLRELVEQRVRSDPQLTSILRICDYAHHPFFEQRTPLTRHQGMLATTMEALFRPEVKRFQQRVMHRYQKPFAKKVAVFLPCSAKKPYSQSKTHHFFMKTIQACANPDVVHELIITSPLGVVPRELELLYPASSYDTTVTGMWDHEEQYMIQQQLSLFLQNNTYDTLVVHLPESLEHMLRPILSHAQYTCKDKPTSEESLQCLLKKLQEVTSCYAPLSKQERYYTQIVGLLSYQFTSEGAQHLLDNAQIKGKYPQWKIMDSSEQLGMISIPRGFCSLTLAGAQRLQPLQKYWVKISDDFTIKGSLLAPGILGADNSIRVGDEVFILRNDLLIGVGVAQMNGDEMTSLTKGEAVKVRHIKK